MEYPDSLIDYSIEPGNNKTWHLKPIKEEMETRRLTQDIRDYISSITGRFTTSQLDLEIGVTQAEKKKRSVLLSREASKGNIVSEGRGLWRVVEGDTKYIEWWDAQDAEPLNIILPLGLSDIVDIYPGDLVVIAGTSDAGKTAFALNLARDNKDSYNIVYLTCELSDIEFKDRVKRFGDDIGDWVGKVNLLYRNEDFDGVIIPDALNIVDYLEPPSGEYYKVEKQLSAIHDKLTTGVAFVNLQKDSKKDIGLGGVMSMFRPRLYMTLDPGKCIITKAKHPKPGVNPKEKTIKYSILNGCHLILQK